MNTLRLLCATVALSFMGSAFSGYKITRQVNAKAFRALSQEKQDEFLTYGDVTGSNDYKRIPQGNNDIEVYRATTGEFPNTRKVTYTFDAKTHAFMSYKEEVMEPAKSKSTPQKDEKINDGEKTKKQSVPTPINTNKDPEITINTKPVDDVQKTPSFFEKYGKQLAFGAGFFAIVWKLRSMKNTRRTEHQERQRSEEAA